MYLHHCARKWALARRKECWQNWWVVIWKATTKRPLIESGLDHYNIPSFVPNRKLPNCGSHYCSKNNTWWHIANYFKRVRFCSIQVGRTCAHFFLSFSPFSAKPDWNLYVSYVIKTNKERNVSPIKKCRFPDKNRRTINYAYENVIDTPVDWYLSFTMRQFEYFANSVVKLSRFACIYTLTLCYI